MKAGGMYRFLKMTLALVLAVPGLALAAETAEGLYIYKLEPKAAR
jgi:hypothetical protein